MPDDHKANILIVDDEPANLVAARAVLDDLGENLVLACSGEEALRRLLEYDFAVVVLDVSMPGMDGFETAELIRRQPQSHHTPVIIFVTAALLDDISRLKGYASGAVDYLEKPLDPQIFRSKVRVFVEMFKATEQVRRQGEQLRTLNETLEQRVAERTDTLQHQTRVLQAVVESMSDGLVVADEHGQFRLWNAAATEIIGIGPTETPPERWTERYGLFLSDAKTPFPPDQLPLACAMRGEWVDAIEVFVRNSRRPDGLWVSASASPLHDPTGTLKGGVVVFRDVTAAKRTQAQAEQFRMAREIQQRLFPAAEPALPGFDIAGASYPTEATGGDYFDYIPMRDDFQGIVIGDASGHGVGAALLMAEARAYLRALALTETDLDRVMALLNQRLVADISPEHFVTLMLLRLDPRTRSLEYANAGHPPGHILDALGAVRALLHAQSLPLGMSPDLGRSASNAQTLKPGDLVLLLTDGITEALDPNDSLFGTDRALSVVRANRHRPAREIVDALCHSVREFSQRRLQADDQTAVVIKVGS